MAKRKKAEVSVEKSAFSENQKVVVYSEEDECYYYAVVLKMLKNGSVKVQYDDEDDEGDIEVVKKDIVMDTKEYKKQQAKKGKEVEVDNDDIDDDIDDDLGDDDLGDDDLGDDDSGDKVSDIDDDLTDKDRGELKEYIVDEELGIAVTKSMSDEDIRNAIRGGVDFKDDGDEDSDGDSNEDSDGDDDEDNSTWFYEGDVNDEDFIEKKGTYRFWVKRGGTALVTFLTNKAFTFKEHQVKMGGRWNNYFTCIAPMGERCPICETNNYAYVGKAYFVVDHSEYVNKAGSKVKDQIKLLVFKQKSYGIFKKSIDSFFEGEDKKNLIGLKVAISRSDTKGSPQTGDIFIPKKKVKLQSSWKVDPSQFQEEFAPRKRKELLKKCALIVDSDQNYSNDEDD